MALPNRKEADPGLCWDLGTIFHTKEEVLSAADELTRMADRLAQSYEGALSQPDKVIACLDRYEQYQILADKLAAYGSLSVSVDFADTEATADMDKLQRVCASCQAKLAFIELELAALPPSAVDGIIAKRPQFSAFLDKIMRNRGHRLQKETESLIRKMHPLAELPYNVYNAQKMADLRFADFEAGGRRYPLDYSLYEDYYEYLEDTGIRRAASAAFYNQLKTCRNVTATAYNGLVTMEKSISEMRNFDSVFTYLLNRQDISEDIYNSHLDILMEKLAPHMRRYAALLQKALGLERMTYADLKVPFPVGENRDFTIESSLGHIKEALSVMGTDYTDVVEKMYREKRIDFAQNAGKSTGAFCESVYGSGSYILCTWQDQISDLFTLAHELGHAVHFSLMQDTCSKFDYDLSMYLVEAPSTFNELLLSDWLTKEAGMSGKCVAAALIGNTFYHNFVTHFLEAYYQREVYRLIDRGDSVNAENLSAIYRAALERFWGNAVELTPGCELTWMRQPHYYSGLYSYTYSASLSVAAKVWDQMKTDPARTISKWKTFLQTGLKKSPSDAVRDLGINIASGEHVYHAIETIGRMIDLLEAAE